MSKITYSIIALSISVLSFIVGKYSQVPENIQQQQDTKFILPEEFNLIDSGEFLFVKELYRNPEKRRNIDSIEFGFVTDPYLYVYHPHLGNIKIDYMKKELYIMRRKSVITGFKSDRDLNDWFTYNFSPISDYGTK